MKLNGHINTVKPFFFQGAKFQIEPETLRLNDGDFLRIYYLAEYNTDPNKTVLLIHGMMGNKDSPVIIKTARQLLDQGYSPIIVEMRNCSNLPNNTSKFFHAGSVEDLSTTIKYLCEKFACPINNVIGFSMGANVLLKWSAVCDDAPNLVDHITCICLPLNLNQMAISANIGLNKVYQRVMLRRYRKSLTRRNDYTTQNLRKLINSVSSILEFDDKITARLNGYRDREDYYQQNCILQYLGHNNVHCSILNSANDPLISNSETILEKFKYHSNLDINILNKGGHLGLLHSNNKPIQLHTHYE